MRLLSFVAVLLLTVKCNASSGPITYSFNQVAGSYTAQGFITTDGVIGNVSESDITAFSVSLSDGVTSNLFGYVAGSSSAINGLLFEQGSDLFASASTLTFDFESTDGGGIALADSDATNFFCLVAQGNQCSADVQGNLVISFNGISQGVTVNASGDFATAELQTAAPEPSSLLLLSTGALGIVASLRRRPLVSRTRSKDRKRGC